MFRVVFTLRKILIFQFTKREVSGQSATATLHKVRVSMGVSYRGLQWGAHKTDLVRMLVKCSIQPDRS